MFATALSDATENEYELYNNLSDFAKATEIDQIAFEANLSRTTVERILSGAGNPILYNFIKIAASLGYELILQKRRKEND